MDSDTFSVKVRSGSSMAQQGASADVKAARLIADVRATTSHLPLFDYMYHSLYRLLNTMTYSYKDMTRIHLDKDIQPLSAFRANAAAIIEQV